SCVARRRGVSGGQVRRGRHSDQPRGGHGTAFFFYWTPRRPLGRPPPPRGGRDSSVCHLQGDLVQRREVLACRERVRVDDLALVATYDQVHVAGPRAPGVRLRRPGGVVGVAVVVANDLHARGVAVAHHLDVLALVQLVAVARAVDDLVPDPPRLR